MTEYDHTTHQLIGQLKGKLDSMQAQLVENEKRSTTSRELVYKALNDIRTDAQDTKHRTESLEKVMNDQVLPVVKGVLDWRSRAVGGMAVITVVGMALIGMFTVARDILIEYWRNTFSS